MASTCARRRTRSSGRRAPRSASCARTPWEPRFARSRTRVAESWPIASPSSPSRRAMPSPTAAPWATSPRGKRRRRMPCRSWTSGPCSLPSPSSLPQPPDASRASRWAWLVGLAVTLALLAWALHDIDPHELGGHLRRADPLLLLAAVALATLTFPLRTLRWQLILRDAGGKRFPLLPLWHATAIGFMANNLLP